MKTTILLFLIFTTFSFGQNYNTWKTYVSEVGQISISFPDIATLDLIYPTENTPMTSIRYQLEKDDILYFAAVSVHASELSELEDICQISLESITNSMKGSITYKMDWYVQGEKGIMAKMNLSENGVLIYKVVVKDRIQYQLVVTGTSDNFSDLLADHFFQTFRITE